MHDGKGDRDGEDGRDRVDGADLLPALPGRRGHRQLILLDAVAAVGYTVALLIVTVDLAERSGSSVSTVDALAWPRFLAVAAIGLPLVVRRLWPRTVFVVVFTATLLATMLDLTRDGFLAAGVALYLVATRTPGRRAPSRAVGLLTGTGVVLVSFGTPASAARTAPAWFQDRFVQFLIGAMVLGAAWTIGRAVRERRVYVARTAGRFAERAVTEERLRIARELHDVVAHSMSLIAVKASTASHVSRARPEEATRALAVIESTSRTALREMRRLLGVLRAGATPGELAPAPGLAGLPELVDLARHAGVEVDCNVQGAEDLPEGMAVSIYRIVQEALTNVVRHAAPTRCRVRVVADGRTVSVTVDDDGPKGRPVRAGGAGGHDVREGHGLIGMRERVAMYGGEFSAGPRPEGGFQVTARWECG